MRTDATQQYLALHKLVHYSWRSQERSRLEAVHDSGNIASSCEGKEGMVQLGLYFP